jgi:hypothetical protein
MCVSNILWYLIQREVKHDSEPIEVLTRNITDIHLHAGVGLSHGTKLMPIKNIS